MHKLFLVVILVFAFCCPVFGQDHDLASVETLAKSSASWNGSPLPAYPTGRPEVSILRIRIPAGTTLPMHRHPVINAGILLRGELTVVTEKGATLHLKAGDPIIEVVDTWHSGKNEGSDLAEIVVFYASTAGQPITVIR